MTARTAVITDWRTRENDLPDLAPGEEYTRLIAPQKFVVLCRIRIQNTVLVSLRIGAVEGVPFELESTDGAERNVQRNYRRAGLSDEALKKRLVLTGVAVATPDSIAISPGLEVCLVVRNDGTVPVKPRAALIVLEEP